MSLIKETILDHLPFRRRQTPSGWISFNAVCCDDKRNRGGLIFDNDALSYHCFNCGFKASWQPGRTISIKLKKLFNLLDIPNESITKICLEALKHKDIIINTTEKSIPKFVAKQLPKGSKPIIDLVNNPNQKLLAVIEYIYSRGLTLDDYEFHYSAEPGLDNRLIIPYYWRGLTVGYTCRRIDQGQAKYLADQQPGYVFNLDNQYIDRKFVIVCEGPIDAISIGGVAVMNNEINEIQSLQIKQLGKKVLVVPDRDHSGTKLIQSAIKNQWNVCFPKWEKDIKDINDAVIKNGKINTLLNILQNTHSSEIKIKLLQKEWLKND